VGARNEEFITRAKERQMSNAKIFSSTLAMMWLFAASGCTPASNGADDIADEVDKALDPDPDYVDPPAAEPRRPQ
jgi:hypothetical protein